MFKLTRYTQYPGRVARNLCECAKQHICTWFVTDFYPFQWAFIMAFVAASSGVYAKSSDKTLIYCSESLHPVSTQVSPGLCLAIRPAQERSITGCLRRTDARFGQSCNGLEYFKGWPGLHLLSSARREVP